MRKVLLKQVKEINEPEQRKSLFITVWKVNGKCFKIVVDSGSTDNLVSTYVAEKINLKRTKHPIPYKVSWLKKGHQLLVNKQCEIDLQIGEYNNKLICDVIPMDVCPYCWEYLGSMT